MYISRKAFSKKKCDLTITPQDSEAIKNHLKTLPQNPEAPKKAQVGQEIHNKISASDESEKSDEIDNIKRDQ